MDPIRPLAEAVQTIATVAFILGTAIFFLACAFFWLAAKVCRHEGRTDGQVDAIHRDFFWMKTELCRGSRPETKPDDDKQLPESGFYDGDAWKRR